VGLIGFHVRLPRSGWESDCVAESPAAAFGRSAERVQPAINGPSSSLAADPVGAGQEPTFALSADAFGAGRKRTLPRGLARGQAAHKESHQ